MQLVWIKRDLRTQDHAPLAAAQASSQPYRVIFIFEPSLMSHPDCSLRHLRFQWQSILDMQSRLACVGRTVDVFWGEADAIFSWLMEKYSVSKVLSYQESGIQKTFTRDQAMHKIPPNDGGRRGLGSKKTYPRRRPGTIPREKGIRDCERRGSRSNCRGSRA